VTATSAFDERLQIGPTTSVERNGDGSAGCHRAAPDTG
jgi:hypothetical protein